MVVLREAGAVTAQEAYPASDSQATNVSGGGGNSNWFNGVMMEIGAFRGMLTTASKQLIEGYAHAWFAAPLAAGHPLASYPPTVLRLAKLTAKTGVAYASQIAGFPPSATGYTATASDGTTLAVSSAGVATGIFASAGNVTVTLTATYNGVALSGSSLVVVS